MDQDRYSKGIVEHRNDLFETSFIPDRTFTSPADFNAQLQGWLEKATARVARTIGLIDHDRERIRPLPPNPLQSGWWERIRLGRDYYIRLRALDDSADRPRSAGSLTSAPTSTR